MNGRKAIFLDSTSSFSVIYIKEFYIKELEKDSIMVAIHMCGWADPILDSTVKTGAPVIEIDQKTNLSLAKEKFKSKCAMVG